MTSRAVAALGGTRDLRVSGPVPERRAPSAGPPVPNQAGPIDLPRYEIGDEVATRVAYGAALAALGAREEVVALDGEVANSTNAEEFAKAFPDRFFQMYIAENQMIATAIGMARVGFRPFAATFAAFSARAYDFIRMAAISSANCAEFVAAAADLQGIVYLRTTRGPYPVLYGRDESFPVGGSKLFRRTEANDVTVIAAGVTVHAALAAAARLAEEGIMVQVLDTYSIKPLDVAAVRSAVAGTLGRLIVVEDHRPEGGLCSAVLEALAVGGRLTGLSVESLAVRTMPGSASPAEQLAAAGIDSDAIVAAAHRLVAFASV